MSFVEKEKKLEFIIGLKKMELLAYENDYMEIYNVLVGLRKMAEKEFKEYD